jgi:hypothetical protein
MMLESILTIKNILDQLETIKIKGEELDKRGFKAAATEASKLYTALFDAIKAYEAKQINKAQVEKICNDTISNARPVLEKHRGWTELLEKLSSIIISVLTIGITNLFTGKKWLFSGKTDSAKKLNELELILQNKLPSIISSPTGYSPLGDSPTGDNTTSASPTGDNPSGDKPTGDKPTGDKPTGDKPAGDKPAGDKPTGDKPTGDKPTGDKPAGDKPTGDKPTGDKPAGDKPAGDKPTGDKPTGDKPTGDKPAGDKPTGDKPAGDKPTGDKPTGDKPTGDKPTGDKPAGDKPTGDKPTGDKPTGDKPTGDKPTGDKPTGDKPTGDKPTGDTLLGNSSSLSLTPTDMSVVKPTVRQPIEIPLTVAEPATALTVTVATDPLQTSGRSLVEIDFLNNMKQLLAKHNGLYSTGPLIAAPVSKTGRPKRQSIFGDAFELFHQYGEATDLISEAQTFFTKATDVTPLVFKPLPLEFDFRELLPQKINTVLLGKTRYISEGLTVVIPGILGFQFSPIVRPFKTLDTLVEHIASMGGSFIAFGNSAYSNNYKQWPKVVFHHYYWDPRATRVDVLDQSIKQATLRINGLTITGIEYFARIIKRDLPTDKFVVTDVTQSPHFKPVVNIYASLTNLIGTDYQLALGSNRAANSFKLLRDMEFLGYQNLFGTLHDIHKLMFKVSAATTMFQASKDVLELGKYRNVLKSPIQAAQNVAQGLLKSSGPWPQDSYNPRLETYALLAESLLGKGDKPSLFEAKMQNLFYNLTITSGDVSAKALTKLGSIAYIPYFLISNLLRKPDEYSWYPNVAEALIGDSIPGLNSSPESVATNKVLLHFINKLAWEQLIIPVLIQLPLKGVTTAASRMLADKLINNPEFILNLRHQLKKLLKSILFNPVELSKFEDFEPPLVVERTHGSNSRIAAIKNTARTVNSLIGLFGGGILDRPITTKKKQPYALFNVRDQFIDLMSAAPIRTESQRGFEHSDFNSLLEKATKVLEQNLGVPGFTKGKKEKSYIETLAYPLVSISTWAWNLFGDAPKAMFKTIENATTLRDLPKREEVEEIIAQVEDSIEEGEYVPVLVKEKRIAKRIINQLIKTYESKIEELSTHLIEVKQQTKALLAYSEELKNQIAEDTNEEISPDIIADVKEFRVNVTSLIEQFKNDTEASFFSNLLTAVPDELDTLIKDKNSRNLNYICFSLLLQLFESRKPEQSDLNELLKITKNELSRNPRSIILPTIIEDLTKLNQNEQNVTDMKIFVDTMKELSRDIILLSSIFISNQNFVTLSLDEFNNLVEKLNSLETKYATMSKTLGGVFINSIHQNIQIALTSIKEKQQLIKNAFAEIDKNFQSLDTILEEIKSDKHVCLPTEEQTSLINKLTQVSEDQPLFIQEYQQRQLNGTDKDLFKGLVLVKLDKIIEVRKKALEELSSKKTATVVAINAIGSTLRAEVMSFIDNFAPADADLRTQCEGKLSVLDTEITKLNSKFDARNELKTTLSNLNKYITKINGVQGLLSSVWIRTPKLLLVHQEMLAVIANTTELLKPFLTHHNPTCKAVLRTMGLIINEEEPVETQISKSISKHLKSHFLKLINIDVHAFIEKTNTAMKGSENIVEIRNQFIHTLNQKFCSIENIKFFDNNKEEIEAYIEQNVDANIPKLLDKKISKFIDSQVQKIKALNVQLHLAPPGRYNFYSSAPISRAVYDKGIDAIKSEVGGFEPMDKRDFIMASISALFDVQVKNPLTVTAPAVTEQPTI